MDDEQIITASEVKKSQDEFEKSWNNLKNELFLPLVKQMQKQIEEIKARNKNG